MKPVEKITVNRHSSVEERQRALYEIYGQVLERQPYAYEHRLLAKAEQDFLRDKIGVKRFLKILGHSEVYLNEFYYSSSNLKFLELCFKHFMGRAPFDHYEMSHYSDILMRDGVNALINQMIDSEEYRKHFGCFTVPYPSQEEFYPSPKAYLETDILNHELHGQRGHVMPTMVWHELGLDCDGGSCDLQGQPTLSFPEPEVSERLEFLQVLRRMHPEDLKEIAASLPPTQRASLSQALAKSAR
ncbi:phycobilisome rod-core linker polypeptide [Leptolyngbya sp. PCC 6406]|uniref:phycobilisome rod-core linker polypeptide n=1 Tax=Leptolyngbya sp. PCC 6406 TaxID=1173264 RepID=UPI0002AC50BE|nr:phycobilisome rod-core linker polypeptide [Leptolyngbya sp. PCC 6406]